MLRNKRNVSCPSHRTQANTTLSLAPETSQEPTNPSVQHFFVHALEITVQNNAFYFRHSLSVSCHLMVLYKTIIPESFTSTCTVIWMLIMIGRCNLVFLLVYSFLSLFKHLQFISSYFHDTLLQRRDGILKSNMSPTEIFHRKISPLCHIPRSPYPRERDPVLILQEAVWAPGRLLTGTKHLASTGILSSVRPARPVASRYTDYTIPARMMITGLILLLLLL
jgi:hypothetical protein